MPHLLEQERSPTMSSKDIGTPPVCAKRGVCLTTELSDNRSQSQLNALPSDDVNHKPLPGSLEDSESEDDQKVVPSGAAHRRRIQNAQFEAL
jgi:hypothetical protein